MGIVGFHCFYISLLAQGLLSLLIVRRQNIPHWLTEAPTAMPNFKQDLLNHKKQTPKKDDIFLSGSNFSYFHEFKGIPLLKNNP